MLDLSKQKEFADDNFKFDENGRKLSKRVENTVGKGEIARNEQFLLFPQCFQKACCPGASKGVIVWEWFNPVPHGEFLNWFKLKEFADDKINEDEKFNFVVGWVENMVGKGENAGYQHFLLFSPCFQKASFSRSFFYSGLCGIGLTFSKFVLCRDINIPV